MNVTDLAGFVLRAGLVVGGVYLALCGALWALQERMIFHPQPLVRLPEHPAARELTIDRGEAVLHGWIVNQASAGPVLIYCGGNAEEVSAHVDAFAQRAAVTVLMNYRGYGKSTGTPSQRAFVQDAVAIGQWAKARFPNRPLVLFGLSLGTGVVALATPQVGPDAVILVSPYRSVENIARATYPIFPVRWMLRHPFRAETAVPRMPRTLVFASPTDRVIPFAESQGMVRALGDRAELHAFELDHGAFLAHPPLWREVDRFLASVAGGA